MTSQWLLFVTKLENNYLRNQRKKHQLDSELNAILHFLTLKIIFIYDPLLVLSKFR
jgi:hypothetical protein